MRILSVLFLFLTLSSAHADWGPGWNNQPAPPPPPGWGHGPGWGTCQVLFQKCDFAVGGFCVKWNHKGFPIERRQAQWGCEMARRQYGDVKNCWVQCP